MIGDVIISSLLICRDRDVVGLDTVVPLETTAAYDIKDVITGVRDAANVKGSSFRLYLYLLAVDVLLFTGSAIVTS